MCELPGEGLMSSIVRWLMRGVGVVALLTGGVYRIQAVHARAVRRHRLRRCAHRRPRLWTRG